MCYFAHTSTNNYHLSRFLFYKFLVKSKIAVKMQPCPQGTFPWLWRNALGTRLAKMASIVGDVTGLQESKSENIHAW